MKIGVPSDIYVSIGKMHIHRDGEQKYRIDYFWQFLFNVGSYSSCVWHLFYSQMKTNEKGYGYILHKFDFMFLLTGHVNCRLLL